ncbi:MAG TPA: hypothetical protein VFQ83_09265 [Candidatus Udaeobacter sp.]|nr:hypothetical protein [Candidatus Udaeobacter sp.]
MTSSTVEPAELLDLKLLPAWVKEPVDISDYHRYAHEDEEPEVRDRHKVRRPTRNRTATDPRKLKKARRDSERSARIGQRSHPRQDRTHSGHREGRPQMVVPVAADVGIRFLPYSLAFENVVTQIKSGSVAYSLYALARLFLEKPERYEVRLTAKAESPLYRLGDNGELSVNHDFLERNAFRFTQSDFYKMDITESEPIKGNFSNVARCRLSGTLLGPTNHHNYQLQLRDLYEKRFSRRMSFVDYQRQIEIANDATLIERWKDEARKVITYTTRREDVPATFSSAAETERHFRSHYLPGLIKRLTEATIGGVQSRNLSDRSLNRAVEDAWARETRSPSGMMQELAGRLRHDGLQVFRHRRGMLFVSPIRTRAFVHEQASVSSPVNAILEALMGTAIINRKQLFEKLIGDVTTEAAEPRKLALASDLRWLLNEGYVIEFNDGSLDLPRGKGRPRNVAGSEGSATEAIAPQAESSTKQTLSLAIWPGPYFLTILSEGTGSALS